MVTLSLNLNVEINRVKGINGEKFSLLTAGMGGSCLFSAGYLLWHRVVHFVMWNCLIVHHIADTAVQVRGSCGGWDVKIRTGWKKFVSVSPLGTEPMPHCCRGRTLTAVPCFLDHCFLGTPAGFQVQLVNLPSSSSLGVSRVFLFNECLLACTRHWVSHAASQSCFPRHAVGRVVKTGCF